MAESQASRNDVSIETDLAADLPAVLGDKIQLQQVILNLMINGIESMSGVSGRPRRLLIRTERREDGQVHVSVHDRGAGVDIGLMARLFEPFFTTRSDGIGMGLPISRSIVEAHGGRLWAESIENHGSVFQFTLPGESGPAA